MFSFKGLLLYVKQPYAAGVIISMWFGMVAFLAIDNELPAVEMTVLTIIASTIVAMIGLRSSGG